MRQDFSTNRERANHPFRVENNGRVVPFVCIQAELAEDQQRYLNYFTDQLEKRKKEEEEIEQLMEGALKEVWGQRDQQRRAEREARNRLMEEVMETRSLQIQHKCEETEKLITLLFISWHNTTQNLGSTKHLKKYNT